MQPPATPYLVRAARKLRSDATGNVLPMMAAALIPTMAMIGGGIDFGRVYLAESKMQGAVDAAALSAVRTKQINSTTAAENTALRYLNANFPTGYLGAATQNPAISVTDVDDVITANVSVTGTVQTSLLRVIGITTLPFSVNAVAEASDELPTSVEALLVLDNTGSMRGSRMTNLKRASRDFVDVIYGNDETRDGFAVGILPYNTMVNVGHLVRAHSSSMVISRPGFTNVDRNEALGWKGCLFADQTVQNISNDPDTVDVGAYDITDNMPGDAGSSMPAFDPFIYPPIRVESFQDVDNRYSAPSFGRVIQLLAIPTVRTALVRLHGNDICSDPSYRTARSCAQPNSVIHPGLIPDGDEYREARFYSHKSGEGTNASPNNQWGPSPNYQCPAEALPLSYSATRSGLRSYINNENEALRPGTGTFHNPAMTWAYRLISRDDVFPRNRPADRPVKRVVIFMTDGNFDSRDDGRPARAGGGTVLDTAYTAYRSYEDRVIINSTSRNDTIEHLSRRFAKTCEAMKDSGIEIYTIAFELNNNSEGQRTREMFRTCATDRNTHFFAAANGADLRNAFVTIAAELIDLRLTS